VDNNNVRVSVIMPSLNVVAYIAECIESALNQTLKEIEIICVDAGSTDGTLEVLKQYAEKDKRVRLIHSAIKSYGHQMNLGFSEAKGKYMAILETDDYILPDMYETLYGLAEKNTLDFIKSDYEIFVGEGKDRIFSYMNSCRSKKQYRKIINPAKSIDIFNARMNTWTGIYNIDFLRQNNIFHNETPGASYQDNGFWFQTFMYAERIMFVDRAFYKLRRDNPNSSVHNRGKVFCIFDEYAFIEKRVREDSRREKTYIEIFQKKKHDNCQYHYSRIADKYKMEFMNRLRAEFTIARDKGELNPKLFFGDSYKKLMDLINFNENIYGDLSEDASDEDKIAFLENELRAVKWELESIKKTKAYKISNKIAFIPRKIVSGIKCYHDNGLKYTINLIKEKVKRLLKCKRNKKWIK